MKKTVFFLIILLSILSCKKNDKTQNNTVNTELEGKVILPQGSTINTANLRVLSAFQETSVINGNIYKMDSSSFKSFTTAIVLNSSEEPLMMRYNYPNNPNNDISAQSTALAMLMNAPAIQSLSEEGKINLINNITKTQEFSTLASEVSKNLVTGKGFIDSTNASFMTAFKNLGTATANYRTNGVIDEPILINQAGKQVSFTNNGAAIVYWVGIYKDGQNIITVPINSAKLFASSYKDLLAGIFNIVGDPSSVDYTFPSDGEYKIFIKSGRVLDNTEESISARKSNLVLGALDIASIWLPGDCLPNVAGTLKTYIEASFSAYTSSVTSASGLQLVYREMLEATYNSYDLKGCIKDQTTFTGFLKAMFKYLDLANKVGSTLNLTATVSHFLLAKSSIDTCFKVTNGIVTSCNSTSTLTTAPVNSITSTTASSGGNITNDGGAPVTAKGVCWSTSPNPTVANNKTNDGTGNGSFVSNISVLQENETYYVRAYATNANGTSYGNEINFKTIATGESVTIGTQIWMAKSLNVTIYRNGESITQITDPKKWPYATGGSWCSYDNNSSNDLTYGKLYNWYAINDPRGLAPSGWHIASDAEWDTLIEFLGGYALAGGKLKSLGFWLNPNVGADNSSGFTAIPGGYRLSTGDSSIFIGKDSSAVFWTSSRGDHGYAWDRVIVNKSSNVNKYSTNWNHGLSVRCIRD